MPLTERRRTPIRRTVRANRTCLAVLAVIASVALPAVAGADPSTAPAPVHAVSARLASSQATQVSAYWVAASDGGIFAFGGAPFYGSTGDIQLNKPVVAMAATSLTNSGGYREVASDGGMFDFGNAAYYGSMGGSHLNKPVVGMAATANGEGYWEVASDGGIFSFGDAGFFGSMGGSHLNQPIVGMAATANGGGYWLVAADGGIFAYGNAGFYGSTGDLTLQQPVVGMAPTHDGGGYWLVAADGGVFAFGDAAFYGSLGGVPQSHPIVSIAATADGGGYWFTNNNGAVTAFGDATYWGSTPQVLNKPVVGMTQGTGNGSFTGSSYPSGSYGYDISNYQCGNYPPSPHTIGIVEVEGQSFGTPNSCLQSEANWAGGGLNLYVYLTYGLAASSSDPACDGSDACNYGFNLGIDAFEKAVAAGVNADVPWWLDVENPPSQSGLPTWSSDTTANSQLIQGALDALESEGLNSVGIYTSPLTWSGIAGSYSPKVPLWLAWYTGDPQQNCETGVAYAASQGDYLPSGALQITQYASDQFDEDYAC